jgi:hypothetical protein
MKNLNIKTHRQGIESQKSNFFVLNKGINSGKPLVKPCPNCFIVEAENEEIKENLYWISYALWRSNAFHPYLVGSVIPFLRIGDFRALLNEKIQTVNGSFSESVKKLQLIESKEKLFAEQLRLIQELKKVYIHSFLNPKG